MTINFVSQLSCNFILSLNKTGFSEYLSDCFNNFWNIKRGVFAINLKGKFVQCGKVRIHWVAIFPFEPILQRFLQRDSNLINPPQQCLTVIRSAKDQNHFHKNYLIYTNNS